ncbi:fam-a protein [Plasmodium vinckei brucechwatti]|uniref:Fam-a protein n=1 Tax=Plasmodium vinckei brucechwatti TaxID=119398 RepID=A0A6V7SPZ5_PLAVN|nr:fam-a protein [Plasmodium vinckei brucechwatti]
MNGYIKIALTLLSVARYMQSIAFAIGSISSTNSSNPKIKQQLSISTEEANQAADVMAEALVYAYKHVQNTKFYKLYLKEDEGATLYFKRVNNTDIAKLELTIPNPDSYDGIINMLWNPNGEKNFDNSFIKGSFSRIYNKNLVIVQRRYKNSLGSGQIYYHALANKVESSKDKTIIVMTSSDMNDHDVTTLKEYVYPIIEYVNPIVEYANSFTPHIDSEDDIRNGRLSKMYVNLVAFFIKKENDSVKVTYVSSIDYNASSYVSQYAVKNTTIKKILNIIKLRDIFKKE